MAFKPSKVPILHGNQRSEEQMEVDRAVWAAWTDLDEKGRPRTFEDTVPRWEFTVDDQGQPGEPVDHVAEVKRMLRSAGVHFTKLHAETDGKAGAKIRVKWETRNATPEDLEEIEDLPEDADPADYITIAFTPVPTGERPHMRGPRGPRGPRKKKGAAAEAQGDGAQTE